MVNLICTQCQIGFSIENDSFRKRKKRYPNYRPFCSQKCVHLNQKKLKEIKIKTQKPSVHTTGFKTCPSCKKEKTVDEFGRRDGRNGIQSYCIPCVYESQMKRWVQRKLDAITYLGGQCKLCGGKFHFASYDFHHRDQTEKEFEWYKLRLKKWELVTKELDKCELLCRNCHSVVHSVWTTDDLGNLHRREQS
jgi:hypothetical protein